MFELNCSSIVLCFLIYLGVVDKLQMAIEKLLYFCSVDHSKQLSLLEVKV